MSILQSSYTPALERAVAEFDSHRWLKHFKDNKMTQGAIKLPQRIQLDERMQAPLIRSIQKFQIGETGEGKHLKKFARYAGDQTYYECIDLFIKEEQSHGAILAEVLRSLDATVLNWHWSDLAFIALRRLFGLKTELFIILIAEVIGKCFYKCVSDNVDNDNLSNLFAVIVCDEIAHLRFHSEFLAERMNGFSWTAKYIIHFCWAMIFHAACFVFVWDHRKTLLTLNVPSTEFLSQCSKEFQRSARISFGQNY